MLHVLLAQTDSVPYYNKTLGKNNFSIELGGKGYLYSIGYERTIYTSKKILLTTSVNVSYEPFAGFDGLIVPIGLNGLIGQEQNKLLVGCHFTNGFDFTPYPATKKERGQYRETGRYKYDYYSPPYKLYYTVPSVGYRRFFKNNSSITGAFTPLIYHYYSGTWDILPWFSINYNFKF